MRDHEAAQHEVELLHLEGMDFIKAYRNITSKSGLYGCRDALPQILQTHARPHWNGARGKKYLPMPSLSKSEQAEVDTGLRNMRAVVNRLHEAGVNIVAGTDSPNPSIVPGFSLHQEMELMVQSGMPPLAVLRSVASIAGKLLRRDDLGVVKPGACADLLLLNANPVVKISNTLHIQSVIKAGRLVDREKVLERIQQGLERER